MKNLVLLMVVFLVASSQLLSQNNETKFYSQNGTKVSEEILSNIEEVILIEDNSKPKPKVKAFLPPIVGSAIPYLVKYLPKLFYNPKKYIKESQTNYSLFGVAAKKPLNSFSYEKTGKNSKDLTTTISKLDFTVTDLPYLPNYKLIDLASYHFAYTPVKLSNKNKSVNLVAEITLYYYDAKNVRQELKLSPITIKNIVPKKGSKATSADGLRQVIPPMDNIENIELKLTEVNARKKDWDKWLERFENNQDKLTELFNGLVAD